LCDGIDRIGADRKTLRFSFKNGNGRIKGIAFGLFDAFIYAYESAFGAAAAADWAACGLREPVCADIAFNIEINEYNGVSSVQVKIVEIKNLCSQLASL
jgi:hypothetical protein